MTYRFNRETLNLGGNEEKTVQLMKMKIGLLTCDLLPFS